MKSIEMHGSKFNTAVVAKRPKEDWVNAHMASHFPGLKEDARRKRLEEVHDACTKAVKEGEKEQSAEAKTVKPAMKTKPAKQEPAL